VNTGPTLIPQGSIQPAGRVYQNDGQTPANGAIVYVNVVGSEGDSAPLTTLVDENGYWYVELVNCRTDDLKKLFQVAINDELEVEVDGGKMGTAFLVTEAADNKGGANLRPALTLE